MLGVPVLQRSRFRLLKLAAGDILPEPRNPVQAGAEMCEQKVDNAEWRVDSRWPATANHHQLSTTIN
jgi:hypothetical protein